MFRVKKKKKIGRRDVFSILSPVFLYDMSYSPQFIVLIALF